MHLIDLKTFKAFWRKYPDAESPLTRWYQIARKSTWADIGEVRDAFPHADLVKVASGHTVTVFNIAGNNYRLITAIHYDSRRVYPMMVLTHKEYDTNKWEAAL